MNGINWKNKWLTGLRNWKNGIRSVLLLAACLMLAACSEVHQAAPQSNPETGTYLIYYLNTSATKMIPVEYQTETTDSGKLISELFARLTSVPAQLDVQSPLTTKVSLIRSQWEDNVLYLYFDSGYTMMASSQEILCRAALTKTLCQVKGVEYLNIYSGEQPLMDTSGNPVGMLAAADFVDSISDVNSFEKTEITLYFADETGESLVEEKREVVHSINTSMERLIMEQLMAGPKLPGQKATIPSGTRLLNVSVSDNICYLNFDSSFLSNPIEVKEAVCLYSIVDSLTRLTTVNRVQFSVNGTPAVMFRDTLSLDALYEQNLDYVKKEGESS